MTAYLCPNCDSEMKSQLGGSLKCFECGLECNENNWLELVSKKAQQSGRNCTANEIDDALDQINK